MHIISCFLLHNPISFCDKQHHKKSCCISFSCVCPASMVAPNPEWIKKCKSWRQRRGEAVTRWTKREAAEHKKLELSFFLAFSSWALHGNPTGVFSEKRHHSITHKSGLTSSTLCFFLFFILFACSLLPLFLFVFLHLHLLFLLQMTSEH